MFIELFQFLLIAIIISNIVFCLIFFYKAYIHNSIILMFFGLLSLFIPVFPVLTAAQCLGTVLTNAPLETIFYQNVGVAKFVSISAKNMF